MASAPQRRKVLVLKDEPSIQRLFILVKKLERENAANGVEKALLAAIMRKQFDAVIVDLRCPNRQPGDELPCIRQMQPSLMGKTLVLTTEVDGPKTLELVERHLSTGLPQMLLWLISHRHASPG